LHMLRWQDEAVEFKPDVFCFDSAPKFLESLCMSFLEELMAVKKIENAKYEKVSADNVAAQQEHLSTVQQKQLADVLRKYDQIA
jgi:hypothetical protein